MPMKRKLLCLLLVCILCIPLCLGASALSPAISVLSRSLSLSKCTLAGNELHFAARDFDMIADSFTESITVLSLPDKEIGTLFLDDKALECPAMLTRAEIDRLTFRPIGNEIGSVFFEFLHKSDAKTYNVKCTLHVLDRLNFAPTVVIAPESVACTTYAGVTSGGLLEATDPDADDLQFQIVSYPQKGTVTLSGNQYCYSAFENSTGNDHFTVVAIDCYGNRSEATEITVSILPRENGLSYADMEGNDAYAAALSLSYNGVLSGTMVAGKPLFCPDEAITRIEFVAALVSALGLESENKAEATFTDIDKIPPFWVPALSLAIEYGIIENCDAFYPSAPITRADAAGMICAALSMDMTPIENLDNGLQCFLMLAAEGIMPYGEGKMNAKDVLSRSDAALCLCRVLDHI